MYKSSSLINGVQYKIGPTIFWIIVFLITSILGYYCYILYTKRQNIISNLDRYAEYLYDYALQSQEIPDNVAAIKMAEYNFNGDALKTISFDSSGQLVPNYKWDTHSEAFLDVIRILQDITTLTADPKSAHYKSEQLWKNILPDFISRVMRIIPIPPQDYKQPWGTNWYQFSITFPLFLTIVCYTHRRIFRQPQRQFEGQLAIYIQNYFKNPPDVSGVTSMGWKRDGPNAIMMAVPYIGGNLLMKTLNVKDNICQYVRNYVSIPTVLKGEGLYPDMGYVFHSTLRAYGYIYSAIKDFAVVAKFFGEDISKLYRVYKRVEHPTIKRHFSPMFTRSASCVSNESGEYGFDVLTSIRAVSVKMPDWYLSFYGQKMSLCYYESDKAEDTWCQIWLGARVFFYHDSPEKWQRELIPYYPGVITFNNEVVILSTNTTTTTTFEPNEAKTMLCRLDNAIAMLNIYTVNEAGYDLSVRELILVDENGYHVNYQITPNPSKYEQILIGANLGTFIEKIENGVGLGSCFKFDKFNTFVYDTNNITGEVKDQVTLVNKTYLQMKPKIKNGVYSTSFSNIHSEVNSCVEVPTSNKIQTLTHLLHFDEKYPDYLWLYDLTKNQCVASRYYEDYSTTIEIPTKILTGKFDESTILNGWNVYKENIIQNVDDTGTQIILNTKVPTSVLTK